MKSTLPVEGQMNPAERLLTIGDLFAFWERRKATVLAAVAVFLLLGLLLSIFSTRRYESEALLEVREPEDTLGLTSIGQNASRAAQVVNPLEETVTLATKVNELTSNGLDLEVIERLHLEGTQDFKHTFNPIGWVSGFFSSKSKADAPGTTLANSPTRRAWALSIFQKQLQVAVVPGTRLISIKYSSSNAETAAQVANELAEGLAQYGYEIKFRTTSRLTSWVNDQLDRVRQNMANMQENQRVRTGEPLQPHSGSVAAVHRRVKSGRVEPDLARSSGADRQDQEPATHLRTGGQRHAGLGRSAVDHLAGTDQ